MKKQVIRVLYLICVLVLLMMPFGLGEEKDAVDQTTDLSASTWLEAFDRLHEQFSTEYAFTEWKDIDWDMLGSSCRTEIQAAQDNEDFEA